MPFVRGRTPVLFQPRSVENALDRSTMTMPGAPVGQSRKGLPSVLVRRLLIDLRDQRREARSKHKLTPRPGFRSVCRHRTDDEDQIPQHHDGVTDSFNIEGHVNGLSEMHIKTAHRSQHRQFDLRSIYLGALLTDAVAGPWRDEIRAANSLLRKRLLGQTSSQVPHKRTNGDQDFFSAFQTIKALNMHCRITPSDANAVQCHSRFGIKLLVGSAFASCL